MKNLKKLGKILNKSEQQFIKGGDDKTECESGGGEYACGYWNGGLEWKCRCFRPKGLGIQ